MMSTKPLLGVFDSGVGGFSVYKKIREASSVNSIYYGDCMRAPYGNREESEIVEFIKDDIQFLQDEGVTHFVNACNSMSVVTTDRILKECGVDTAQYTDMIRAFSKHASFLQGENVLVVATQATIRSKVYQDFLRSHGVVVFEYVFTDLAKAIEVSATKEELLSIIGVGVQYAKDVEATKIVYGCTHYPLAHQLFLEARDQITWRGEFIDPAVYVAQEVAEWQLIGESAFIPYSSKDTPAFIKQVAGLF